MSSKPNPGSVWYAIEDSTILERVRVVNTVILPLYGRYIFYQHIDWPVPDIPPACCHETVFKDLYIPQDDEPCATQLPANSSSKTSSQQQQPWFTDLHARWQAVTNKLKSSWW